MSFRVKILPDEREIEAIEGAILLELLLESGAYVDSLCSGRGFCGRCVVQVIRGGGPPGEIERRLLGENGTREGLRLACVTEITADMEISLVADFPSFPEERKADQIPDKAPATLVGIEEGKYMFRVGDVRVFLGEVPDPVMGVAVDAGTTTIESALVDLKDGTIKGEVLEPNRQIRVGADIVSRISYGIKSEANRETLRKLLFESFDAVFEKLLDPIKAGGDNIVSCSISGNVFIIHSLLGMPLNGLAAFPFSPPLLDTLFFPDSVPLPINRSGCILAYPAPGAFVGGDLVSGAVALSLDREGPPSIFMDIGTNTEILVRRKDRWVAASAPSGGAFEGAEIQCGKMALPGAVVGCDFDSELMLRVIGEGEPDGIAGSGLISIMSFLRSQNILTGEGKLLSPAEARGSVSPSILWRLAEIDGESSFILYLPERGRKPVYVSQSDVRNFQTAKSAMRAGLEVSLKEAGLEPNEVERVYLSGAFGGEIDENALFATGMLPPGFAGKIIKGGNTSLKGAYLCLVDVDGLTRAKDFAKRVIVLHLGGDKRFSEKFIKYMDF